MDFEDNGTVFIHHFKKKYFVTIKKNINEIIHIGKVIDGYASYFVYADYEYLNEQLIPRKQKSIISLGQIYDTTIKETYFFDNKTDLEFFCKQVINQGEKLNPQTPKGA